MSAPNLDPSVGPERIAEALSCEHEWVGHPFSGKVYCVRCSFRNDEIALLEKQAAAEQASSSQTE